METVLNVVLSHQAPEDVDRLAAYWESLIENDHVLVAYGGPRESFDKIQFQRKLFIDDPSLRTLDHQREGQSYTAVFQEVSRWLNANSHPADVVTLFEFDHIPLVSDLNLRQIERMRKEHADVVAYHLARVDGTSHAHYLYYAANAEFARFLRNVSVRKEHDVVFSMFGTGSCWKREAFDAVAGFNEPFPIYFELYLPTLAHHLGFRLRDYASQDAFVSNLGDRSAEIQTARDRGAWSLHPVKDLTPVPASSHN
jgi:hypothetical protein